MKERYYVCGIGKAWVHLAVGEKETVKVPKNGIEKHKTIPANRICVDCESWNILDEKRDEYYCPICE